MYYVYNIVESWVARWLFQFGLGITIINTKFDQEIMVKKEMKFKVMV